MNIFAKRAAANAEPIPPHVIAGHYVESVLKICDMWETKQYGPLASVSMYALRNRKDVMLMLPAKFHPDFESRYRAMTVRCATPEESTLAAFYDPQKPADFMSKSVKEYCVSQGYVSKKDLDETFGATIGLIGDSLRSGALITDLPAMIVPNGDRIAGALSKTNTAVAIAIALDVVAGVPRMDELMQAYNMVTEQEINEAYMAKPRLVDRSKWLASALVGVDAVTPEDAANSKNLLIDTGASLLEQFLMSFGSKVSF